MLCTHRDFILQDLHLLLGRYEATFQTKMLLCNCLEICTHGDDNYMFVCILVRQGEDTLLETVTVFVNVPPISL